jgi:hypothetical protein
LIVEWRAKAREDRSNIFDYIAEDNPTLPAVSQFLSAPIVTDVPANRAASANISAARPARPCRWPVTCAFTRDHAGYRSGFVPSSNILEGTSMSIVTVGIDLAKSVFAIHGIDEHDKPVPVENGRTPQKVAETGHRT